MKRASLELSKKLKELGYPQESLWYWRKISCGKNIISDWKPIFGNDQKSYKRDGYYIEYITAPTVEELIDELPPYISCYKFINNEIFGDGKFGFGYGCETHDASNFQYFYVEGITMADACAEAWIYCKKNELLEKEKKCSNQ